MSEERVEIIDTMEIDEIMEEETKIVYPCIALRGVSIFPNTVTHFDIGREKSIRALEKAMSKDKLLFVSTQKDENVLIPTFDDVYGIGTLVKIMQVVILLLKIILQK